MYLKILSWELNDALNPFSRNSVHQTILNNAFQNRYDFSYLITLEISVV